MSRWNPLTSKYLVLCSQVILTYGLVPTGLGVIDSKVMCNKMDIGHHLEEEEYIRKVIGTGVAEDRGGSEATGDNIHVVIHNQK
jgi:hypothetical protein